MMINVNKRQKKTLTNNLKENYFSFILEIKDLKFMFLVPSKG